MVCTFHAPVGLGPTRAALGLALILASADGAAAQVATAQKVGVTITQPQHGAALENSSFFFLPATEAIQVRGVVTGIPPAALADYVLILQGAQAPTLTPLVGTPDAYTFAATLWIGPDPSTYPGGGPIPPSYQYLINMVDTRRLHLPILVEVVYRPTNTALARARNVIHDTRFGSDPRTTARTSAEGVAFQLTERGLDALEPPHRDTIPWPTLAAFNDQLETNATGIGHSVPMTTRFGSNAKACIPLDQATALKDTAAWPLMLAEAQVHYDAYLAAKQAQDTASAWLPAGFIPALIVNLGVGAYLATECVRELPVLDSQFEVCVQTLDGDMTDLAIAGTTDVDLGFGATSRHMLADVTLGRVDGTVRGRMADVFIRWAVKHNGCVLRPQFDVAPDDIIVTPAMDAWSTCDGLQVDALAARTLNYTTNTVKALDFIARKGADLETLAVKRSGNKGLFSLSPDRSQVRGVGTCAAFDTKTEALLDLFYPDMKTVLNDTWKADSPTIHQAQALDELLAAFEVGTNHPRDLGLTYTLDALQSRLTFPGGGTPTAQFPAPDGLVATMTTDAALTTAFQVTTPWTTWVSATPVPLDQIFSVSGLSYFNVPFDAAYTVTTNAFNQMIRERSGTDLLYFTLQPTWGDLGMVAGPAGEPATDPAVLTGTLLSQTLDPLYAAVGNYPVTILARATLLPFTFIPPDQPPPGLPQFTFGHAPVTYQLAQYRIEVLSDNPLMPSVLTMVLDMFDDGVDVRLHSTTGRTVLEVDGQNDQWQSLILSMSLACPFTPRLPLSPPAPAPPACEGPIAQGLADLVQPVLHDKLMRMLRTFPAPQVFKVPSATNMQLRELHQVDRFTDRQRIVLYGDFRVPQ